MKSGGGVRLHLFIQLFSFFLILQTRGVGLDGSVHREVLSLSLGSLHSTFLEQKYEQMAKALYCTALASMSGVGLGDHALTSNNKAGPRTGFSVCVQLFFDPSGEINFVQ